MLRRDRIPAPMTLTLHPSLPVEVGLTAAIVAVREDEDPVVVVPS